MTLTADSRNGPVPVAGADGLATVSTADLTMEYPGGVLAASGISIEAREGEVIGIVGPNGAGKSTILKMLATLIAPTAGSASIHGFSIKEVAKVRPLLGIALQDVGLDPLMTGEEHFEVQAALIGKRLPEVEERMRRLVEDLVLGPYLDRAAGACSGGTQRRLALALALLGDPKVVIFDEPTAGLDPRARRDVWRVVEELSAERRTVLFSTQYLDEADHLSDRLYLIDQGQVVASGRAAELKAAVGKSTLEIQLEEGHGVSLHDLPPELADTVEVAEGARLRLRFDRAEISPQMLFERLDLQHLPVLAVNLSEPSLDDVFFHFTMRSLTPEPLERATMDLGTRMHRGGGKKWG